MVNKNVWHLSKRLATMSVGDAVANVKNSLGTFFAGDGHNANNRADWFELFDTDYYCSQCPEFDLDGQEAAEHFLKIGGHQGKDPHPLFDVDYYLAAYPDVAAAGINPLVHFVSIGWKELRNPHPLFDTAYYLEQNPDVYESKMNPLMHFLKTGYLTGKAPHPAFDIEAYKDNHAEILPPLVNPLLHFVTDHDKLCNCQVRFEASSINDLSGWLPKTQFVINPQLSVSPRLNVLIPSLMLSDLTGGPNTILILVGLLAKSGVPIRLISINKPLDNDLEPVKKHIAWLSGQTPGHSIEFVDGHNRFRPVSIGENDVFFATVWWSAQLVKAALSFTKVKKFLYLIQDFEPILYPASTDYALALETYELNCLPIVNSKLLYEYFVSNMIGRFADQSFVHQSLFFEPAVDRSRFHPVVRQAGEKKRLLFYARPNFGHRNLFQLGAAALGTAIQNGTFNPKEWEFVGIGENFKPVCLFADAKLTAAPWSEFDQYIKQSDLLLSMVLSAHPSYPPLEMAACGNIAVTNTYSVKTAEKLRAISDNLVPSAPNLEALVEALNIGKSRLDDVETRLQAANVNLPLTWEESFKPILPTILAELSQLGLPAWTEAMPAAAQIFVHSQP